MTEAVTHRPQQPSVHCHHFHPDLLLLLTIISEFKNKSFTLSGDLTCYLFVSRNTKFPPTVKESENEEDAVPSEKRKKHRDFNDGTFIVKKKGRKSHNLPEIKPSDDPIPPVQAEKQKLNDNLQKDTFTSEVKNFTIEPKKPPQKNSEEISPPDNHVPVLLSDLEPVEGLPPPPPSFFESGKLSSNKSSVFQVSKEDLPSPPPPPPAEHEEEKM